MISEILPIYSPTSPENPVDPKDDHPSFYISTFNGPISEYCQKKPEEDLISNYLAYKNHCHAKWGVHYQILQQPLLISIRQVKFLLHRVDYVFQHKYNISNQKEMELLLYLSLQRQITEGLKFAGIAPDASSPTLKFTQIFFGLKQNLQECVASFEKIIDPPAIQQWDPPTEPEFWQILQKYHLTKQNLEQFSQQPTQISNQTTQALPTQQETIPFKEWQRCFEDLFNFKCLGLFIENVRPTKLYE